MKYQYLSDPVFSVHRSDSFTRHKAPLHPATAASVLGTITQLCSIRPEGLSAFWGDLTENQIILWLPFFGNTVLFPFIQTGNNKNNFLLRPLSLFGIVSLSHAFCTSGYEWLKCKSMHRLWLRTLYTFGCYSMRVAISISGWMHFKTPTSDKNRGFGVFFFNFLLEACCGPTLQQHLCRTSSKVWGRVQTLKMQFWNAFTLQAFALNPDFFLDFFQHSSSHCLLKCGLVTALMWPTCAERQHDVTRAALYGRKQGLGAHRCEHVPFHF